MNAGCSQSAQIRIDGWGLTLVRTPLLGPTDELYQVVAEQVSELHAQETLVISEKVAVMTTGRAILKSHFPPGRLALLLVRFVQPRKNSRGLSVPEKMEYVVRNTGLPRLLLACFASALTRPFGLRGMFYRVAGSLARDLDGGRPPFEDYLFPPLSRQEARDLCHELAACRGHGVVIADINDFGGSIRARSRTAPSEQKLMSLLRDNPMGQRDQQTPLAVLTPDVLGPADTTGD